MKILNNKYWSSLYLPAVKQSTTNNTNSIVDNIEGTVIKEQLSLIDKARDMRKNPTIAEAIMWKLLRNKKIGIKFRRQHIIGDFIVDFVDLNSGTIIEIDGGYHNEKDQIIRDNLRSEKLVEKGYTIIRFTNEEVLSNPEEIILKILSYIKNKYEGS